MTRARAAVAATAAAAALPALAAMAAASPALAQTPSPAKFTEWPGLKKAAAGRVRSLVKQYRKPKVELHAAATKKLIKIGSGAAPVLIPLVNDRAESANEHLFEVLDAIVDKRHAALLAREMARPSVSWRRYLTKRLAGFHDAELAPVLKTALKDKDEDIKIYAGLGLLAQGRADGLDIVMLAAKQRWTEFGDITANVLTPARSGPVAIKVFEKIASARPTDQMAGLRLLRHLMTKEQGMLLRTYLQSADFTVKREAINTARVVHGEKPLKKLSSFQAINLAKKWLQKL